MYVAFLVNMPSLMTLSLISGLWLWTMSIDLFKGSSILQKEGCDSILQGTASSIAHDAAALIKSFLISCILRSRSLCFVKNALGMVIFDLGMGFLAIVLSYSSLG